MQHNGWVIFFLALVAAGALAVAALALLTVLTVLAVLGLAGLLLIVHRAAAAGLAVHARRAAELPYPDCSPVEVAMLNARIADLSARLDDLLHQPHQPHQPYRAPGREQRRPPASS